MRGDRPSLTARWVAAQRAGLAATRPVGADGDVDAEQRLYEGFSAAFRLPGLRPTGMAVRTRFFDEETTAAIAAGVGQVVIVGAGYDGRALRFRTRGVRWFEVDHPATQADKRRRMGELSVPLDDVSLVGVDLERDDLHAALQQAGHSCVIPSLFLCEGLLAYLSETTARSVCRTLRSRAAAGSRLAVNVRVTPSAGGLGRVQRGGVDWVLRLIGEHRRNEFHAGDAERLLEGAGWVIADRASSRPNRLDGESHLLVLSSRPAPDEPAP